ncbi:MAG: HAD family hydrolase, partial [Clostridia bacterium]|nr:HAD family hydrolase [Clostridia bacterium]
LLDTLQDLANSANLALKKNGLPPHPTDAYRYFVGDGVHNLIRRALGDRQELFDQVMADYRAIYARNREINTCPYPGIEAMLEALRQRGIKVCVFSNKPDSDTQAVIRHYFPHYPFEVVRGSLPGVGVKPDPAGANAIVKALEIPKEELLYAGDTSTDMDCARNAGIASIGVTWGFRLREELEAHQARWIVDDPMEIVTLCG